jgi:hypothetical protein
MGKESESTNGDQLLLDFPFAFGASFLRDHAGQIITEPRIALIEMVANGYDAGATQVSILWPGSVGDPWSLEDNGTGMTRAEFSRRWKTLSYNRTQEQGEYVEFPPGTRARKRPAFGRSGKGRHASFCFSDEYEVETWKDGQCIIARVKLTSGGREPFHCEVLSESPKAGHGTIVRGRADRSLLSDVESRELIGAKFVVDPAFCVLVNGCRIELMTLEALSTERIDVPGHGGIEIHRLDAPVQDRTARLRGITWWVNDRMVGEPSWEGLDGEGHYLDGRTSEAKKYSFVVKADLLRGDVKQDWSGFHANAKVNAVREAVHQHVVKTLYGLLADDRKRRKRSAISQHKSLIRELPESSKRILGQFIDEVQEKCPNLTERDLLRTVEIFGKLEEARSRYQLLKQLASCSPEDLDTWNRLMQRWTATSAEIVLGELQHRLALVVKLQKLVRQSGSDELHDLQPLFERGLWIFGPEYEAVDFRSNRGMTEIVRNFFSRPEEKASSRRPDFITLPDRSLGFYGADSYEEGGEVRGFRKVLIVELKRTGFEVTLSELDQARNYATELRKRGCAQPDTKIVAYVLGTSIEQGLEHVTIGDHTKIQPATYDTVLNRAQARTFQLQRKLESLGQPVERDPDVEDVLSEQQSGDLFDEGLQVSPA